MTLTDSRAAQATYKGSPRPQKMLWSWYSLRDLGDLAGQGDGPGEVVAIDKVDLLTRYMNDYRFFLRKIGTSHDMIDIEPDFWGYVRSLGNPHQVAAQVSAANPTDCGSQENSAAGLAHCLVAMARKYAPNAAVGLHLTCWDWQTGTSGCVRDYQILGAQNADFLVTDVSDRDAGWYALPAHGSKNTFWTDQKAAAALAFYKTMTEAVGKPLVLWQIPVAAFQDRLWRPGLEPLAEPADIRVVRCVVDPELARTRITHRAATQPSRSVHGDAAFLRRIAEGQRPIESWVRWRCQPNTRRWISWR